MGPTKKADAYRAYSVVLCHALKEVEDLYRTAFAELRLCPLNHQVLVQADPWPNNFGWAQLTQRSNNCRPRNFGVSVYWDNQLVGLAFGRTSKSHSHVRVDFIESAPFSHAVDGFLAEIILTAAKHYAAQIDAKRVLITNPSSDQEVRELFARLTNGYYKSGTFPFDYYWLSV